MSARRTLARLRLRALESRLVPATYTVLNSADAGAGSLRGAILAANANPGADAIDFDTSFFATPRTITLTTGTLVISDSVTITGTSAVNCSISGNNSTQVFAVNGAGVFDVTLARMSIKSGNSFSGPAGVSFGDENLTISECSITGCINSSSLNQGGGIGQAYGVTGGSLSIINSTISNNTSSGRGGGVFVYRPTSVSITGSTLAGNSASDGAGVAALGGSVLTIENSTVSGNRTATFSTSDGGGVYFISPNLPAQITIRNATFSGNTAGGYGGGIFVANSFGSTAPVGIQIQNATIVSNRAFRGGGVGTANSAAITVSLTSGIVSGNTSTLAGSSDFIAGGVSAKSSAIGSTTGITTYTNLGGNFIGAALNLGALASNGGPTQTHALLTGSPIIDKGENPLNLSLDQRGLPRNYGPTDIGAFELIPAGKPYASGTFPDVVAVTPTIPLTVTFTDDAAIQFASLGDGDLRVTGPAGFLANGASVKLVSVNTPGDGTPRTATYSVAGPGGTWDVPDFGVFQVYVEPGQVGDLSGNTIPFSLLGQFTVNIPINVVVTNSNDSGPGSLRQAVLDTNANPAADSITFNLPGAATITLASPLAITDGVKVIGPGASMLTVSGNNLVRVFDVNAATPVLVAFSGITVSKGFAGTGAGLLATDESITLTDMVFESNQATVAGGAVYADGTLTVTRSTFRDNRAQGVPVSNTADGAALYLLPNSRPTVVDSLFEGNQADDAGGAIRTTSSLTSITITGSSFISNLARDGGGISLFGSTAVIRNSTFSTNSVSGIGGAIHTAGSWGLTLTNSTIANNSAMTGGGLGGLAGSGGTITITSSVLSNSATTAPDVFGGINQVVLTDSLVGSPVGFSDTGTNTLPYGINPRLAFPADNGGPTPTRAPFPGSPIFDRGANPAGLAYDQRGSGFSRVLGAKADIGAMESVDADGTPIAIAFGNANVSVSGGTTKQVKVSYFDDGLLDATTFGDDDIRIVGPGGFDVPGKYVSVDVPGDGSPRVVTYEFTPPGGSWDAADNGSYSVVVQFDAVRDTLGFAASSGAAGAFRVAIPRSFVVTTTADDGPGSLRQALRDANANSGAVDTITFSLTGANTISLTTGELVATDGVTITGPGSNLLTISGGGASRHFTLEAPGKAQAFTLSGLTLTAGKTTVAGGSITTTDDAVTLTNMQFIANTGASSGGAIRMAGAGTLNISDSVFTNNAVTGFASGGAIAMGSGSMLTLVRTSLVGNSANYTGGAISTTSATVALSTVTFTNNTAGSNGGAIDWSGATPLTITAGTLTGNSAGSDGGAIYSFSSAPLTITLSTLTGNSAGGDGGAIYWGGGNTKIADTTISNNSATANGGGAILYASSSSTILIDRSAFVGNVSKSTSSSGGGGGLYIDSFGTATSVTVVNSTFSGNSAAGVGGGIASDLTSPAIVVRNSTIVNNTASGTNGGGGIARTSTGASTITLESSVISSNTGANPDLYSTGTITAKNSAVGSKTGVTTYTDLGANLAFGINVLLAPLENNGGPTPTHRPLPGSPLLDMGANPSLQNSDQRGQPRSSGTGVDIGAYEVQPAAKVTSVTINNGDAQRSRVTTLKVQFDRLVSSSDLSKAFTFVRQSDSAGVTLSATLDGTQRIATITFVGGPLENGSLADGRYTLTALASQFTGDGIDGDYTLVGTPANGLYRLFGDADGSGQVDASDFLAFRLAFLSPSPSFDFDGDGTVGANDLLQFRLRFLQSA
ncbi:MAG: right-handed parallel beta-helix repeat-containing protein [Gemmataceae bacterium]|nr:right-handed parallel beta-helix repeat-containing protein [Gemmataceae bacterium]